MRSRQVEAEEEGEEQRLGDQHHDALEPVGARDLDEGHQVHALVLGFLHQRADPAVVVAHPAQATQVDQRGADHAGDRGDGFQHDRPVAVALGEEGVGQEAQAAGDAVGQLVGPVAGFVVAGEFVLDRGFGNGLDQVHGGLRGVRTNWRGSLAGPCRGAQCVARPASPP